MHALVLLLIAPDVDRLGSPDWPAREAAQERLSAWGIVALPSIADAARTSECPETRDRCRRLLTPWRSLAADLAAARLLCDPWPMDVPELVAAFNDDLFRRRLHRLALANGCTEADARRLHPDADVWCWFQSFAPQSAFAESVESCKRRLGNSPGWPFP